MLLSNPDSLDEYNGFRRVESLDCCNSSSYSSIDSFFVCWLLNEENFINELIPPIPALLFAIFPIDKPLILFVPDSSGTIFLGYLSYEKAFLARNSSSSLFLLSFCSLNFPTTSANRSVAPSGGFSSSFLFFFPLPPFFSFSFSCCSFYSYFCLSIYFCLYNSFCLSSYFCLYSSNLFFSSSYFLCCYFNLSSAFGFVGYGISYFLLWVGFMSF